eukprot:5676405-Pyramimonas_sp.AAC.1
MPRPFLLKLGAMKTRQKREAGGEREVRGLGQHGSGQSTCYPGLFPASCRAAAETVGQAITFTELDMPVPFA